MLFDIDEIIRNEIVKYLFKQFAKWTWKAIKPIRQPIYNFTWLTYWITRMILDDFNIIKMNSAKKSDLIRAFKLTLLILLGIALFNHLAEKGRKAQLQPIQ